MVKVAHLYTALSFLTATTSTVSALVAGPVGAICPAAELCGDNSHSLDLAIPDNRLHVGHAKKETNAERFDRGEPPLKPTRRYTGCVSNSDATLQYLTSPLFSL